MSDLTIDLSLQAIYNELLAGKVVSMHFESPGEAEAFRITMHRFKKLQDTAIIGVGMEECAEVFSFSLVEAGAVSSTWALQFNKKKPSRTYKIISIQEATLES